MERREFLRVSAGCLAAPMLLTHGSAPVEKEVVATESQPKPNFKFAVGMRVRMNNVGNHFMLTTIDDGDYGVIIDRRYWPGSPHVPAGNLYEVVFATVKPVSYCLVKEPRAEMQSDMPERFLEHGKWQ